jgi:hypothetical protein
MKAVERSCAHADMGSEAGVSLDDDDTTFGVNGVSLGTWGVRFAQL